MNLSRACLATLVLMPWLAVAGAVAVAHELLTQHRLWWAAAGCTALVAAFEASVVAYKSLKTWPVVSRAEAVRRLEGCGWWLSRSSLGPPFEP
jgi:FAD/FMN-containing dehydrogenase